MINLFSRYIQMFIPKSIYSIILNMTFEMEMAEEIPYHVSQLKRFFLELDDRIMHYSFPYYNVFCFYTMEEEHFIEQAKQLPHTTLYQRDNKPWYFLVSHNSGYQTKMGLFLKEHPDYPMDPFLRRFYLYDHPIDFTFYDAL